ncbi:MAG: hypothetical protein ACOZAO_02585 [Patescibacteria group bacterium]
MENNNGRTIVHLVKRGGKYGIKCPETGKFFVNGRWVRVSPEKGCNQTRAQCTTVIGLRSDWHLESRASTVKHRLAALVS